ncbi:MAG: winged helix-turn-helix domain-containing protein [Myxococcota bacterium]|nr:winged helix-turn-helix domain-containing protein [Myxococcota bacterium]
MRYFFGDFEFKGKEGRLYRHREPMRARPKLIELLRYLIIHRRQLVTREELLNHLWPDVQVGQTSLSTLLNEARHLLGDSGYQQKIIQTESRRGYCFVADVAVRPEGLFDKPEEDLQRALRSLLQASRSAIQDGDLLTANHCLESALKMTGEISDWPFQPHPLPD